MVLCIIRSMEAHRERFFDKVDKTDSCWLWKGCISCGYGRFTYSAKSYGSHCFSWLLAGNTIPEGHLIRHKCRNRHCVNPEHLETGTREDNMADKVRDGTVCNGSSMNSNSKLTEEQARTIRANPENKTIVQLGEQYGIHNSTVSKIILRKTWKHL